MLQKCVRSTPEAAAFLTPQVPRGSDTDNEVTAFPKGCNDLAPQQHVLAYLVESRLIWDPFERGMPQVLFLSRRREKQGLRRPTFFPLWHLISRYNLTTCFTPSRANSVAGSCWSSLVRSGQVELGQVRSKFTHFWVYKFRNTVEPGLWKCILVKTTRNADF